MKKSHTIKLNSRDLYEIFYNLKKDHSFNDIKETFLFHTNLDEDIIKTAEIKIPKHKKYLRFKIRFNNFSDLFNYMKENKDNKLIIPYHGIDTL